MNEQRQKLYLDPCVATLDVKGRKTFFPAIAGVYHVGDVPRVKFLLCAIHHNSRCETAKNAKNEAKRSAKRMGGKFNRYPSADLKKCMPDGYTTVDYVVADEKGKVS